MTNETRTCTRHVKLNLPEPQRPISEFYFHLGKYSNWCKKCHVEATIDARKRKAPGKKKSHLEKSITAEEWKLFIAAVTNARMKLFWKFVLSVGFRITEALEATPNDVDFSYGVYNVVPLKRSDKPTIPVLLPPDVLEELKQMRLKPTERYFPFSPVHAWREFKRTAKKVGIKSTYSPHSLRHLFAMRVVRNAKGDVLAVTEALRHRSTSMAMYYIAADPEEQKKKIRGVWDDVGL
jgi:integrase